jgi:predicted outer membrane protein
MPIRMLAATVALAFTAGIGTALAEPQTVARDVPKLVAVGSAVDAFEIASGHIALERATRPPIRALARHLILRHAAMAAERERLAALYGATLPPGGLNGRQRGWLDTLQSVSPRDFDATFAHIEVLAHVDSINLYSTFVTEGRDPVFMGFSKRALSSVHDHYRRLEAWRERLETSGGIVVTSR